MEDEIPKFLYRGDSDPNKARKIKETWGSHGFLLTNLTAEGSPSDIFSDSLISLINRHVHIGWKSTHFLSFSENYDVAKRFAGGHGERRLVPACNNHWDSAIFTFDTDRLVELECIEKGVFLAAFSGRAVSGDTDDIGFMLMRLMANRECAGELVSIVLVDVVSYVMANMSYLVSREQLLENSRRDSEWLVLPISPPLDSSGLTPGFTGCLDDGCIKNCEKFIFFDNYPA